MPPVSPHAYKHTTVPEMILMQAWKKRKTLGDFFFFFNLGLFVFLNNRYNKNTTIKWKIGGIILELKHAKIVWEVDRDIK